MPRKRQTRRSVAVRKDVYRAFERKADAEDVSMSSLLTDMIHRYTPEPEATSP